MSFNLLSCLLILLKISFIPLSYGTGYSAVRGRYIDAEVYKVSFEKENYNLGISLLEGGISFQRMSGLGYYWLSEEYLSDYIHYGYPNSILSLDIKYMPFEGSDFYVPIIKEWKKRGEYDENKRCWEAVNGTIQQAAIDKNIPVARIYDAFNGINHDEDAVEKGYIGSDGVHTSEKGQKVIADLFRELGYESVP